MRAMHCQLNMPEEELESHVAEGMAVNTVEVQGQDLTIETSPSKRLEKREKAGGSKLKLKQPG